jgi:predicted metal-dependent hydrolase
MGYDERKLFFEEIGNVSFIKKVRAKRLTIRINSSGNVKVTVPYLVSYRNASLFVEKKSNWIIRIQNDLKKRYKDKTIFRDNSVFNTINHTIRVERYSGDLVKKKEKDGVIQILIPVNNDIESQDIQEKIRNYILVTWREEARVILSNRINELALMHNFKYDKIRIKNMRTRWGSCSQRNTINLNLHLIRLPDHLRDYILLHELVHTVHKNHGMEFWKTLINLNGNAKKNSRELKSFNIEYW